MTANIGLVLDCHDAQVLAKFWAAALGYDILGSAGTYTLMTPPGGDPAPQLVLQEVSEPKSSKLRMHLDIHILDIETEAKRLVALGARRIRDEQFAENGSHWIQMEDPEGNEFCVCDNGGGAC
jgi:predicted enzyme related to lactoylglutathione lyase